MGCLQSSAATLDADGSCTNSGSALVQNTYDTTVLGTQGQSDFPIGRLTRSQSTTTYPSSGGSTVSTGKQQYDQRGRLVTQQLKFNTPNSWNLTLPTYQLTQTYSDANQPVTTQTSTLSPNGTGYTFSNIYDSTLGVLTGVGSTTSTTSANLATLSYTVNGLLAAFNFQTTTGTPLATETFSYDGNLRPTEEAGTWQSGSGQSGVFSDEARGYDAGSNVATVTTTLAQANGQSGSHAEVQNFCYDEHSQLVWAGNSGTQPGAGSGTCGTGTLANSFSGASYASSFAYTHLGQLWQGPLAGAGSSQQYLYCNSLAPHQLSDIVPSGQNYSCANLPPSIPYATSYDSWGNVTARAYNSQSATLSSNKLDQLVMWQVPGTNQAWYAYDAGGQRTLQRSTVGSTTTATVYAFGLEEYTYDSSSNLLSSTHYYRLAGHLLGELTGSGTPSTNFFLTTALGSVLAVISNPAGSATLRSTQLYAPYGSRLFQDQAMSAYTNKGFTGQYNDPTSGLDYYVSRFYDPVASVFLSADTVLGNGVGLNPYGYVSNNPETYTDPTGQMFVPPGGGGSGGSGGGGSGGSGGEGRGNPFWPPPGGVSQGNPGGDTSTNTGACQMLGCRHVVNLDSGSVWVWVSTGGSGPSSVSGGTSCGLMDMGGFSGLTCTFTPSSSSGGYWVRLNRPPTQTVVCTYNCSDEPTGSSDGEGQSKTDLLTSDGGAGAKGPPSPGEAAASIPGEQPVNPRGEPYPITTDPRTSQPIPFPENEMTWTAKENRVIWNNDLRGDYIKEWIDRGYPDYGKTGWESLDIHHILPREWGGTNDFWNLGSG